MISTLLVKANGRMTRIAPQAMHTSIGSPQTCHLQAGIGWFSAKALAAHLYSVTYSGYDEWANCAGVRLVDTDARIRMA